jgi:hypothetical protein
MNTPPIQIGSFFFSIRPFKFLYKRIEKGFWQIRIGWLHIDQMTHLRK